MKRCFPGASLLMLLAVAVLPACTSLRPADTEQVLRETRYQNRYDSLAAIADWSLEGRLAVRNEDDGGSGHFQWAKMLTDDRMEFHGALGRGAWRLRADDNGAVLELADGEVHRSSTVTELVSERVGWDVPVQQLSWWVRGLAAPGSYRQRSLDDEGNLIELLQAGWHIEYGGYRSIDGVSLPIKMTARQGESSVKLAVRSWTLGSKGGESG